MKRVPNRRKRESQIGGREKCDFCVYNMEEKLVFPVDTCYLCVSDSNDVPNLVVTMHFRQENGLKVEFGALRAPIAQMADIGFKVVLLERLNQKWKQKHF